MAKMSACKCGHAEKWHNRTVMDGGANWAPVGCYYITDHERPTVCGCGHYEMRAQTKEKVNG